MHYTGDQTSQRSPLRVPNLHIKWISGSRRRRRWWWCCCSMLAHRMRSNTFRGHWEQQQPSKTKKTSYEFVCIKARSGISFWKALLLPRWGRGVVGPFIYSVFEWPKIIIIFVSLPPPGSRRSGCWSNGAARAFPCNFLGGWLCLTRPVLIRVDNIVEFAFSPPVISEVN